jgi:Rieske Fe-S protein
MSEHVPPIPRRTVLRGVAFGGGIAAAGVLAGCGDGDEEGSSGSESASEQVTVPASDVAVGSGEIVAEKYVVTQPTEGEFMAFTAICTHQGCVVASVSDNTIQCDCHGSQYDAATGEVTKGPAPEALAEVPISVEGDEIVVG